MKQNNFSELTNFEKKHKGHHKHQNGNSGGNNLDVKSPHKVQFDWLVSNRLGEFGKYQKNIYILLGLPAIVCGLHALSWVFIGANVPYRCQLAGEDTGNATYHLLPHGRNFNESFPYEIGNDGKGRWSQCRKYEDYNKFDIPISPESYIIHNEDSSSPAFQPSTKRVVDCEGKYVYDDSQYKTTARIDLICGNAFWYTLAETLFKAGIFAGALVFGNLSDRFGRRRVYLFALCQQAIFGVVAAIAPNYTIFVLARFLIGMAGSGVFLVAFVLAMELVGKSKRMVAAMGMHSFFTVGYVIEGIMAYFIRDWRYLQLALSLPAFIFMFYYWFMPESIRWLLANGRKAEAIEILKKAATTNKITIPESELMGLTAEDESKKDNFLSCREILKHRKTMIRSLNVFLIWFVNSAVYYGLALNSGNLGGNDYVNFLLSGAVEIPGYIMLLLTLNRFGRKIVTCGCMISSGIFLIACGFVPSDLTWLLITFNMLGKLFNASAYAAIYIFAAELYPTVIRNSFMGISSMMARVGSILSDYIILVQGFWKPLPHLIFGTFSLTVGLLSLLLPETLGKRLPETMEDGEAFGTSAYDDANEAREEMNGERQFRNNVKESCI